MSAVARWWTRCLGEPCQCALLALVCLHLAEFGVELGVVRGAGD